MTREIKLFIFTIVSTIIVAIGLINARKYIKNDKNKNVIFIFMSLLTILIHYGSVFRSIILGEPIEMCDTYYLPVYPCNVVMWESLVLSILLAFNKKGKAFYCIANGMFFIGTICVFVGIAFNINFLSNPNFLDFDILKGLLSHVTLLFCCLYLLVGEFIEVRGIVNFFGVFFQGITFLICGFITNTVKELLNHPPVNSMFLKEPPLENMPYLNVFTCGIILLIIYYIVFLMIEKKKREI